MYIVAYIDDKVKAYFKEISLGKDKKEKSIYIENIPIEKNLIYIREYRHNLGKIQERKGVHIVYISKYLLAKTKKKNSVLAIYIETPLNSGQNI